MAGAGFSGGSRSGGGGFAAVRLTFASNKARTVQMDWRIVFTIFTVLIVWTGGLPVCWSEERFWSAPYWSERQSGCSESVV